MGSFCDCCENPQVYFKKEGREYKFTCSKEDVMRNVVIRFCQQNKMNKELYFFIHNNDFLNENSKYKNLFPDQNNKRIISIILKQKDISVKKNDPKLISMESIKIIHI
jgi:hypothetical protein